MGMLAGFFEEICQIHFPSAVRISRKTDGFDERLIGIFGIEEGAVNAAKVDKIERSASHDEHWLKFVELGSLGKIEDPTAVVVHRELANTAEFPLNECLVCERFGAKGHAAARTESLLLLFGLNG